MSDLLVTFIVWIIIYITSRKRELEHYENLKQRELLTLDMPIFNEQLRGHKNDIKKTKFISSSIVLSDDLFKFVWAGLKHTFGGRIEAYEVIMDRARREVILRLKESCPDADAIANLQIFHCSISKRSVELMAYGTAIYWNDKGESHGH